MSTYTAVVNPVSGGRRAPNRWSPVGRLLRDAGATVHVETTRCREHAIAVASEAASRGHVVVAVGGDGLVRDVACGVVPHGGRLAIVRAGRGNDFARVLGLPETPDEIARMLLDERCRSVDVLQVGDVYVPGNVYAGIDARATQLINANRWLPAALLYRVAPVRAILSWRAPTYEVRLDGSARSVRAHTVVVGNSGAYGHGLRIVPSARLDDGLLHVLVVGDGPRREVVGFMSEARTGAHVRRPEVSVESGTALTLDADRPLPLCADGDQIATLPARIRVCPGALNILTPSGADSSASGANSRRTGQ